MKPLRLAGIAALFLIDSGCSSHDVRNPESSKLEAAAYSDSEYLSAGALTLKKAASLSHLTKENKTAYTIKRESLVNSLAKEANQEEFQLAYLPKRELLINLTKERGVDLVKLDMPVLDSLIANEEELFLIHNHSNINLNSDKDKINPLYWLAPSHLDLWQYMNIASRKQDFTYGIITQHGLLTIRTDRETFNHLNNPYFQRTIRGEAEHIQLSLIDVKPKNLESWAKGYRGGMALLFEPAK